MVVWVTGRAVICCRGAVAVTCVICGERTGTGCGGGTDV